MSVDPGSVGAGLAVAWGFFATWLGSRKNGKKIDAAAEKVDAASQAAATAAEKAAEAVKPVANGFASDVITRLDKLNNAMGDVTIAVIDQGLKIDRIDGRVTKLEGPK